MLKPIEMTEDSSPVFPVPYRNQKIRAIEDSRTAATKVIGDNARKIFCRCIFEINRDAVMMISFVDLGCLLYQILPQYQRN